MKILFSCKITSFSTLHTDYANCIKLNFHQICLKALIFSSSFNLFLMFERHLLVKNLFSLVFGLLMRFYEVFIIY